MIIDRHDTDTKPQSVIIGINVFYCFLTIKLPHIILLLTSNYLLSFDCFEVFNHINRRLIEQFCMYS
ncbi:hypothetical protein QTP88_026552 [Uroleucon formosanum]